MNGRAVGWIVGCVHLALAAAMLLPAVVGAFYREEASVEGCLWAAFVTAGGGAILCIASRRRARSKEGHIDTFHRELLASLGLSWVAISVLGALPFLFSGAIASPVDAIFESASGFTTTGATVLGATGFDDPSTADLHEGLDHAILFWRSFSQWLGGLAIVLVFVLLLPGGALARRADSAGASRRSARQRVRESVFSLVRVYVVLTAILVGALWGLTRELFDSFLAAFSTLSSGGFSSHGGAAPLSDSVAVKAVLVFFMILAGLHFHIHDALMRRGWGAAWGSIRRSAEVRMFVWILVFASLFLGLLLWGWGGSNGAAGSELPNYAHFGKAMGDACFATVSMGTTTGAVAQDFDRWPLVGRLLLMGLAAVGACSGSTGGGIKVVRLMVAVKAALRSLRRFARPRTIQSVRWNGATLDEEVVGSVLSHIGLWFGVFCFATLVIAAMLPSWPGADGDLGLVTSATAVLACLGNVGHGLAAVGPMHDFGFLPAVGKLFLAFLMILGRLELYIVLVLFAPRFWRS